MLREFVVIEYVPASAVGSPRHVHVAGARMLDGCAAATAESASQQRARTLEAFSVAKLGVPRRTGCHGNRRDRDRERAESDFDSFPWPTGPPARAHLVSSRGFHVSAPYWSVGEVPERRFFGQPLADAAVNVAVIGLGSRGREILTSLAKVGPAAQTVSICDNFKAPVFVKKTEKTPRSEIELALTRAKLVR